MMQISCPWCGTRDEREFVCGGTTHLSRPPLQCDDRAWGEYLFFRDNPKGLHLERWRHAYGCGYYPRVRGIAGEERLEVRGFVQSIRT